VMADLCGFRHDSLQESPKRGNFQNPTCASGDAIDFAGMKPSIMARVGTDTWDNSKTPRGAASKDGGISWTQFGSEPEGSSGSGSVAVSADGAVLLWAAKDAPASRSTDSGATWVRSRGLPDPVKVPDWSQSNLRLAADRVNARKFYAFDALTGRVYFSEDGAVAFEVSSRVLTALPEYNLVVASIQTVPDLEGHVWIAAGKELFRSIDSGRTYSALSNVEESYGVGFGRAAEGRKHPAIYLSAKVNGVTGFFRSDDEGKSFVRINDDAHQYGGSNLIIGDPRIYGRAYVAPGGRGIIYGEPQ
jgi:xyloglucan-specific exo-beta-1,4-glucanase